MCSMWPFFVWWLIFDDFFHSVVHPSNFYARDGFWGVVILVAGERAPGTRFCPQRRNAEGKGGEAREVVSRVRAKTGKNENGGTPDPRQSVIARQRERRRKMMMMATRIGRSA